MKPKLETLSFIFFYPFNDRKTKGCRTFFSFYLNESFFLFLKRRCFLFLTIKSLFFLYINPLMDVSFITIFGNITKVKNPTTVAAKCTGAFIPNKKMATNSVPSMVYSL